MAPTPLSCSKAGCEFSTPLNCPDWDKMVKLLEIHTAAEHGTPTTAGTTTPAPKLETLPRPSFNLDMTQAEWSFKESQWKVYINQTNVKEQVKVQQLKAACDEALLRRVHDAGGLSSLDTEVTLLAEIKKLAVRVVHKTLHLQNMWAMSQSPGEPIRAFTSRLIGTADLCDLSIQCSKSGCNQKTSYRDQVVLQALLKGMHDVDIRTRVLSRTQNNELIRLADVVDYIAAEEASSASFSSLNNPTATTIAAQSTFRKQQQLLQRGTGDANTPNKCKHCGGRHAGDNSPTSREQHCKAFGKTCTKCGKLNHFAPVCRSSAAPITPPNNTTAKDSVTGALVDPMVPNSFYALQTSPPTNHSHLKLFSDSMKESGPVSTIPLPHIVHNIHEGWKKTHPKPSPIHPLAIKIDTAAYSDLNIPVPRTSLRSRKIPSQQSCLDTGAQLTTIPASMLLNLGVKEQDLFPVLNNLNTVTGMAVDIIGGILLVFTGTNPFSGACRSTRQLAYVSRSVPFPFLSQEACIDLGVIPTSFPSIGSCDSKTSTINGLGADQPQPCTNTGVSSPGDAPCSCPVRQPPPSHPAVLPCEPTKDNVPVLKQFILDRYAASAFNICEHQPLPLMKDSPPLRLFVDEAAKPVAVHTPASVPRHWEADVQAGLDRDERLGVIRRVPVNRPTTWCSRMLIQPKHDGTPRRVVDYQQVNDHCPRQTHHTRSPWQIASSVPANTFKTVCDAWHGYHSVPIHPADRHLTTFITQKGRYEYLTAPQGLLSAGDGYTQRGDEIIGDFPNHVKCVDDSLLWGDNIETIFTTTCAFLDKCSAGGMVFHPNKFQFGEEDVNYLGYRVTKTGLKPSPDFLNNIRSFPSPKTITDVRSWFGAVNQISYTFAVSEAMIPFRQLLRPQIPFSWSDELEAAFRESKEEIIRQCEKGVRLFNLHAPTGLATDWSKNCMGFWLVQKHCTCPGPPVLGCCRQGWQTVFCGSKFNTPAESKYPPIEGEAAAAVFGLQKCAPFILGHPNLQLALDHKPLIKIFGSATLESITNPRLFSLKTKTLRFRFTPVHVAGKKHVVPDTFSRRSDKDDMAMSNVLPAYSTTMGPPDWISTPTISSYSTEVDEYVTGVAMSRLENFNNPPESLISGIAATPLQAITWQMLEAACQGCEEYKLLHLTVQQGAPELSKDWDQRLLPYHRHRHLLTTLGPVVLINDRPVVPKALRPRAVDHFHSGHPGLSTMCLRLSSSLYWPDYKEDLLKAKLSCTTCMATAPSNPAMPPQPPVAPQYPFQSIVCDFFTLSGNTYAAVADRYSNWLSILRLQRDTAEELIRELRNYFATFGIAEIFSTDGASIFTSSAFSDFCVRWGIQQRISSSYFPRSNKRAEVAVKAAKRMIRDSLGPGGTLDTDALTRALLAHRNTPDPLTELSPAQVIFGRSLRDFLPCSPGKYLPRTDWRINAENREITFAKRHIKTEEKLSKGSKKLSPLAEGDQVYVQDQSGSTPRRWSKSGRVLELAGPDSYLVKIDGSNRITQRNRQFLRKIQPYQADTDLPSTAQLGYPPLPTTHPPTPATDHAVDHIDPIDADNSQQDLFQNHEVVDDRPHEVFPTQEHQPLIHAPPPTTTAPPATNQAPAASLPPHLRERWFVNPNLIRNRAMVSQPSTTGSLQTQPSSYQYQQMTYQDPQPTPTYFQHNAAPPSYYPHCASTNYYQELQQLENTARLQAEASNQLSAYLAFLLTNKASSSLWEGGITSTQTQ